MSACVKCGNVGNGNIWQHAQAGFGSWPAHDMQFCEDSSQASCWVARNRKPEEFKEHIDMRCKVCGYNWAEPYKDAKL